VLGASARSSRLQRRLDRALNRRGSNEKHRKGGHSFPVTFRQRHLTGQSVPLLVG
jgi:hypothetical protein